VGLLGEFSLAVSFEGTANVTGNERARSSARPRHREGPTVGERQVAGTPVGQIDNRGSHFYIALYWAQELAAQTDDAELALRSRRIAGRLLATSRRSSTSCCGAGSAADIGGYYAPTTEKATGSCDDATFNAVIDALS